MKQFVEDIRSNLLVVTPTENEWAVSGRLVNRIATARRFDIHKTREIHFDVLIALSARRIGAAVITCNGADFTAIPLPATFPREMRDRQFVFLYLVQYLSFTFKCVPE